MLYADRGIYTMILKSVLDLVNVNTLKTAFQTRILDPILLLL